MAWEQACTKDSFIRFEQTTERRAIQADPNIPRKITLYTEVPSGASRGHAAKAHAYTHDRARGNVAILARIAKLELVKILGAYWLHSS